MNKINSDEKMAASSRDVVSKKLLRIRWTNHTTVKADEMRKLLIVSREKNYETKNCLFRGNGYR